MRTKEFQIEQKTNFEKSLLVLDEAITILQRIQQREERNINNMHELEKNI